MIGAFLGPAGVAFTLFAASIMGSLVGGGLMLIGKAGRRTALPFGTFLAPAAVLALFVAPLVFAWYQRFLPPCDEHGRSPNARKVGRYRPRKGWWMRTVKFSSTSGRGISKTYETVGRLFVQCTFLRPKLDDINR